MTTALLGFPSSESAFTSMIKATTDPCQRLARRANQAISQWTQPLTVGLAARSIADVTRSRADLIAENALPRDQPAHPGSIRSAPSPSFGQGRLNTCAGRPSPLIHTLRESTLTPPMSPKWQNASNELSLTWLACLLIRSGDRKPIAVGSIRPLLAANHGMSRRGPNPSSEKAISPCQTQVDEPSSQHTSAPALSWEQR